MLDLLKRYFDAFQNRDLEAVSGLFSDQVTLQDPHVGLVRGRKAVLEVYASLFETFQQCRMEFKRCYSTGSSSHAVEFVIYATTSDGTKLVIGGIDCIEYEGQLIKSLRAYLDESATAVIS